VSAFAVQRDGNKMSVLMEGDLTAAIAPGLKSTLQEALAGDVLEVEFDFEKTTVIDSTGIGLLIATYNSLSKKNGTVRVVKASEDIFHLLQSMRLEKRLCVGKR
jgi:anti-sigma B factor antagonist